ncbi:conserved hypothetical protein [Bacillus vallismortis]
MFSLFSSISILFLLLSLFGFQHFILYDEHYYLNRKQYATSNPHYY